MPFIRRTLKAAFWGVPGPAIVGSLVAFAIGYTEYLNRHDNHDFENDWPWLGLIPAGEAAIGSLYGLMRACVTAFDGKWRHLNLVHGAFFGAVAWAMVGIPLLLFSAVVAIFGMAYGNYGLVAIAAGICVLHLACGAIAGFHVEYYLLHGREPE
jgi:hypothetical protein